MISTTVSINFAIFIPILIATITAIVGPLWLSRRKETLDERNKRLETTGELSVRIIDEGRDMRLELRARIDSLEKRIADSTDAFQDALEQIRTLKSENERCTQLIEELKKEIKSHTDSMSQRVDALEHPDHDKITDLGKTGGTNESI